jgi:predicted acylesterase/phospholipase RssA
MKVAFQAGVLQVWLDEAGLEFDHVDGASGGCFNLAMVCQEMSGTQIADNWRGLPVNEAIDPNWSEYPKLFYAESLMELDRMRERVFTRWGLDWEAIRASPVEATFNTYNFTRHELAVVEPAAMSEDMLVACVSLPMWFPPIVIDGETYIDAVFITDANLEEAIRRGADELWIIWTVSERSEWQAGFVGNYFGIIETAANGHFRRALRRIEAGEFGRPIEVKLLRAVVPLHYLVNANADRVTQAVERGVEAARAWCEEEGIELKAPGRPPPDDPTRLSFTEEMKGYVTFGEADYDRGYRQGREDRTACMFHLTITAEGVERFIADPGHEAPAQGWIECERLGGRLPVEQGRFNLFVDTGDPSRRRMRYRLFFQDGDGNPRTLTGYKVIEDDPGFDVWDDTTTLFTSILEGHVEDGQEGDPLARGILRIHVPDFLKQLTTFRVEGASAPRRAALLARFGALFMGSLWDVYARRLLSSSPV